MAKNLSPVEVEITLAGKKCYLNRLTLNQEFNAHHTFEARIEYEQLEAIWMEEAGTVFGMIGEDANIEMRHKDGSGVNLFNGIITRVEYEGEDGEKNYILFYGCSPTIRLDGKKTMDSFMDKNLSAIVGEAVGNSGNGGAVSPSPVFGGTIDYICQFDESCFEFLNRLSWLYGEWFFYDGTTCYFGRPGDNKGEDVTYDINMNQLRFSANLIPGKVNLYHYLVHQDKEIDKETPGSVPGVIGYHQVALRKSDSVYTAEADLPSPALPLTMSELHDLAKAEKGRSVANMLTLRGRSDTSKIGIGKKITFKLPASMRTTKKEIGQFLIVAVKHEYDQTGNYSNTFTAIPSEMENIPMVPQKAPVALPQIAWVKSNADAQGRGRVKVEFQWQKRQGKTTNWIRVATPDAGSSGVFPKNRGYVFIPEEGDQVMVGFENGDPNRPYVAGSIFPENVSIGGGEKNHLKTIKTRSGHMIEFNDSDNAETIKIRDINANEILYDTRSKTITVSTLEQINLVSKTIRIDASEDFIVSVGRDMQQSIGNNFTQATSGESRTSVGKSAVTRVENDFEVVANRNIEIESGKNTTLIVGNKLRQDVESNVDITSIGGKTNITSKGKIEVKSNDKVHIK